MDIRVIAKATLFAGGQTWMQIVIRLCIRYRENAAMAFGLWGNLPVSDLQQKGIVMNAKATVSKPV